MSKKSASNPTEGRSNIDTKDEAERQASAEERGPLTGRAEWALRDLVEQFAEAASARVCRAVVAGLRRLPGMLEETDSVLRNAWDEICVQVQGQESMDWESAYIPTIEQFIGEQILKLSVAEKQAIWLQTNDGSNWLNDLNFGEQERNAGRDEGIPFDDDDVVNLLLSKVLGVAADYKNARIQEHFDKKGLARHQEDMYLYHLAAESDAASAARKGQHLDADSPVSSERK